MDSPAVSILLPTHDRAEVLAFAIASVQAQSSPDWELLVVGDGCTDGTAALVAPLAAADPRIRWFDLPKAPGFGYANRNRALAEARGRLVAFLGHDNLLLPHHVARFAALFEDPAVAFAASRPMWVGDDGRVVPFFVNLGVPAARRAFLTQANVLPATCVVYRRDLHGRAGMWPEAMERDGDWDLWKRIAAAEPRGLRSLREPTCLHFRASWRRSGRWAPPPHGFLDAIAASGGWYPAQLTLGPFGAALPQAAVWQAIAADPGFTRRLRLGCDLLADHLAWSAGLDPLFA